MHVSSLAGRVCIVGLDCLTPQWVFDHLRGMLPNLERLTHQGTLRSCIPAITVPAWSVMFSGCDPGELGVYGFCGRGGYDYHSRAPASSMMLEQPMLWDWAGQKGLRSSIVGVPQTYPARPLNGKIITGCLTPSQGDMHASYPPDFWLDEVSCQDPPYSFDVPGWDPSDPPSIAALDVHSQGRFALAQQLARQDDWDLLIMVDMASDRLHHGYWPTPPELRPKSEGSLEKRMQNHAHEHAQMASFYQRLDKRVGALMDVLHPNDHLLVISDHGAQAMLGGVALNRCLAEAGLLRLHEAARTMLENRTHRDKPMPCRPEMVDWHNTQAWADGGYVGRIHFNIKGREPKGQISQSEISTLATRIQNKLATLQTLAGQPMPIEMHTAEELYPKACGYPPDLTVIFDNMAYRALGGLGFAKNVVRDNDKGMLRANHAQEGVFFTNTPISTQTPTSTNPAANPWDILSVSHWVKELLEPRLNRLG